MTLFALFLDKCFSAVDIFLDERISKLRDPLIQLPLVVTGAHDQREHLKREARKVFRDKTGALMMINV